MAGTAVLEQALAPLEKYLKWPEAMDIQIQSEGKVFIRTVHGNPPWIIKKDSNITFRGLRRLAEQLAVASRQKFHDTEQAELATTIPIYGYRAHILGSGIVGCGFAISIRIASAQKFPLSSYFKAEDEKYIRDMIIKGGLILIVGGTGSGKTTLMNSMLDCFPQTHRLITIEDAKELEPTQENVVDIILSKSNTGSSPFTYVNAINASVRMNPDAILLGEITVENTPAFLNLSNTGHGSSIATIHCDEASPEDAYNRMALNCIMSGIKGATFKEMYSLSKRSVDLIITIEKNLLTGKFETNLHKTKGKRCV